MPATSRFSRYALTITCLLGGAILLLAALNANRPVFVHSAQPGGRPDAATQAAFAGAGCAGCHTIPGVDNATGQVGPDLSNIGQTAAERVAGLSAADYIRQSILDPGAIIAPACPNGACPANVMPPNFGDRLSATEIDLIVAYLATLEGLGVDAPVPTLFEAIPIVRPPEASGEAFAAPPTTYDDAQVLLGQYLFFDTRLSGNGTVSCAACHEPTYAWANDAPLSRGYTNVPYFRNAPTVMNTVFLDRLYWDGRMDGADMPTLVRDHITEAHFMNSDGRLMVERVKQVPEYVQLFEDAFGGTPSFGRVLNALTAYVHSLNSGPTPYDRFLAGDTAALSTEARAGLALFEGVATCSQCHSGPLLTDGRFYNINLPPNSAIWDDPLRHITFRRFNRQLGVPNYRTLGADPGLYALTKDTADFGAFRTTPLREVARTAPYMHDGSLATLAEVVAFYNTELELDLSDAEIAALVAFLESLSSEPVAVSPPASPPYQLRTLGENR